MGWGRALTAVGPLLAAVLVAVLALGGAAGASSSAVATQAIQERVLISGLIQPTAVRFSRDGRVFVALKGGEILVFDNLADTTPTVFADLRDEVFVNGDHGLFGLALDPSFPRKPYVYVLYTYDGSARATTPHAGTKPDACQAWAGKGCATSGRLSVLTALGDASTGERVLVRDWCGQFDTHSVGDLAFGSDGQLYASAGDGAGWRFADYGQRGLPPNPCGDPAGGKRKTPRPPAAEGGALRAQDLLTPGDPQTLDGTIIRIDPHIGAASAGNPLVRSHDANTRRLVADGLKQPFRFTMRPRTSEVWLGDVGAHNWEEINRVPASSARVLDFGWPCYEGPHRQQDYEGATQISRFDLCRRLYAKGPAAVTAPVFAYRHHHAAVPGDGCPSRSSAVSGVAFADRSPYPGLLSRALFFVDGERGCLWAMLPGSNGRPDPHRVRFVGRVGLLVDLVLGPGRKLYAVDFIRGALLRVDATP